MKILYTVLFSLTVTLCFSQKIKYKDLFPLLEAKNYEQAEPNLRTFLADEKNSDEGNAHYQFATMMDSYFLEGDLLEDKEGTFSTGDTAIAFYNLAKGLIDEKELRKNDEFYQSFYRRDLRTGEFGIKISDVHLDIEKKIEAIENRKSQFVSVESMLASIEETEKSLISSYNSIIDSYDGYEDFVMAAGLSDLSNLGTLSDFQTTLLEKSQEITKNLKSLGIEDSYQTIVFGPISDNFSKIEPLMTLDGSLESWDVETWVSNMKSVITNEVGSFKTAMGTIHEQLVDGKSLLQEHTRNNFPTKIPSGLITRIQKWDVSSAPKDLLQVRIHENIAISLSDTLLNEDWSDSTLIAYHVKTCDSISSQLASLGKLLPGMDNRMKSSAKYYSDFYNKGYGSVDDAVLYVGELQTWVRAEMTRWDTIGGFWNMRNNWGISETDTIPLNPPDTSYSGRYQTKGSWVVDEYDLISYGIRTDSAKGFVARFGPDRRLVWELTFESLQLTAEEMPEFEIDTLLTAPTEITFYLFNQEATAENLSIINFTKDGTLNWDVDVLAEQKPVNSNYDEGIRQHTIFLFPQEAYPLPDGQLGYIVIDQNGEAN